MKLFRSKAAKADDNRKRVRRMVELCKQREIRDSNGALITNEKALFRELDRKDSQ
jgi:hypothetical protein